MYKPELDLEVIKKAEPPIKVITIDDEFLKGRPLSYSSLKQFDKSPQHYLQYLTKPFVPTAPMILGNLFECLLVNKSEFKEQYVLMPYINKRTNAGKAEYAELISLNKGKTLIDEGQYETACNMVKATHACESAMEWIYNMKEAQRRLTFTDKDTGLPMLGYSDLDNIDIPAVIDIKTSVTADPDEFFWNAKKFKYHLQAGIYYTAYVKKFFKFPKMMYIVVENKEPYGVAVFQASKEYVEFGKFEFENLLKRFRRCMDADGFNMSYEFRHLFNRNYHNLDYKYY